MELAATIQKSCAVWSFSSTSAAAGWVPPSPPPQQVTSVNESSSRPPFFSSLRRTDVGASSSSDGSGQPTSLGGSHENLVTTVLCFSLLNGSLFSLLFIHFSILIKRVFIFCFALHTKFYLAKCTLGFSITHNSWPDHTKLFVQLHPWNCWGLCWEIDVDPPIFTLLESKMLIFPPKRVFVSSLVHMF